MNIRNKVALGIVAGILLMISLNPTEEQHRNKVATKMVQYMSSNASTSNILIDMYATTLIDTYIKPNIHKEDYGLYSFSSITLLGQTRRTSFGILGMVFVYDLKEPLQ
jgi:hypothetical protein